MRCRGCDGRGGDGPRACECCEGSGAIDIGALKAQIADICATESITQHQRRMERHLRYVIRIHEGDTRQSQERDCDGADYARLSLIEPDNYREKRQRLLKVARNDSTVHELLRRNASSEDIIAVLAEQKADLLRRLADAELRRPIQIKL